MKNTFNKGSTIFNALSIRENLAKAGLGKERVDEEVLAFEKSQWREVPDLNAISAELEMGGVPPGKVTDALFRFVGIGEPLIVSRKLADTWKYEVLEGIAHQATDHSDGKSFFAIRTRDDKFEDVKKWDVVTRGKSKFVL